MVRLKRLLLGGAGCLAAFIAQPSSAAEDAATIIAAAEMTDLSVSLTASALVARGDQINVSVRVNNAGPNQADVVSLRLELGAGLIIANLALAGGTSTPTPDALGTCVMMANILSCQLPQLPSGGAFTFNVVTSATTAAGSFSHIANVTGSGTDLSLGNNSAGTATTVSEMSQNFEPRGGGGGGGSTSPFMLAGLLLLSGMRVAANKFQRTAR